jgi:hypothetical protein
VASDDSAVDDEASRTAAELETIKTCATGPCLATDCCKAPPPPAATTSGVAIAAPVIMLSLAFIALA